MTWHLTAISIFVVGVSIYVASHVSMEAGWWLVAILLLGIVLFDDQGKVNPNFFANKLYEVGFPKP